MAINAWNRENRKQKSWKPTLMTTSFFVFYSHMDLFSIQKQIRITCASIFNFSLQCSQNKKKPIRSSFLLTENIFYHDYKIISITFWFGAILSWTMCSSKRTGTEILSLSLYKPIWGNMKALPLKCNCFCFQQHLLFACDHNANVISKVHE